jgi:hypothetical protein
VSASVSDDCVGTRAVRRSRVGGRAAARGG